MKNLKPNLIAKPTLVDQVALILQQRIESEEYPKDSQLPIEADLVEEFNTSRTTIRAAVDRLISKHLIVRKHGVGTFVSDSPKIMNPLDAFTDFQDLIRNNGKEPCYHRFNIEIIEADEYQSEILEIDKGDKILEILKYWTAKPDENPVVYCRNLIPLWVLPESEIPAVLSQKKKTEPIVDFFKHSCKQELAYYVASQRSDIVQNCDFELFETYYKLNTPLLIIDEVGYNQKKQPVHQSIEYHPDNIMNFSITRRL